MELSVSWIPLVVAVGAGPLTSLLAGLLAARRPARIPPGRALGEAAVERLRPGVIRTVLGVAALAGGIVMTGVAASASGDDAANAALGVVMLFMLAVALLGPLIARLCAWLIGLPRAGPAPAHPASANSRANARRLASAITPIVLAMAFASTLVFMHTSEDHAGARQRRAGIVADQVISAPDGLPAGTAARAASVPGVAASVGLPRTGALVPVGSGDGRWMRPPSVQDVSGSGRDLVAVQDLDVRQGRLDALGPGRVAVDAPGEGGPCPGRPPARPPPPGRHEDLAHGGRDLRARAGDRRAHPPPSGTYRPCDVVVRQRCAGAGRRGCRAALGRAGPTKGPARGVSPRAGPSLS